MVLNYSRSNYLAMLITSRDTCGLLNLKSGIVVLTIAYSCSFILYHNLHIVLSSFPPNLNSHKLSCASLYHTFNQHFFFLLTVKISFLMNPCSNTSRSPVPKCSSHRKHYYIIVHTSADLSYTYTFLLDNKPSTSHLFSSWQCFTLGCVDALMVSLVC